MTSTRNFYRFFYQNRSFLIFFYFVLIVVTVYYIITHLRSVTCSQRYVVCKIIVNNTVLEEYQTVCLDGGRLLVPVPELGIFSEWSKSEEKYYRYYIEDNDRYKILKFLYNSEKSEERMAYNNLLKTVLLFSSDEERICFESYVNRSYSDFVRRIENCKEYDNIGAGDPYKTTVYRQRLRGGIVLNDMLKEYRNKVTSLI